MGRKGFEVKPVRAVIDNVLTPSQCKELIHVYNIHSVQGYRDNFTVATPREIICSGLYHYLIPIIRVRDKILSLVEDLCEAPMGLYVEWTGISCWHPNSSIPTHFDSNRPYLTQRHYSVVVYLNDYGVDFEGGEFNFVNKENTIGHTILPQAGKAVIFSSGEENTHSVAKVESGQRLTFTMWLTFDYEHKEDTSLLTLLASALAAWNSPFLGEFDVTKLYKYGVTTLEDATTKTIQAKYNDGFIIPHNFSKKIEVVDFCSYNAWKKLSNTLFGDEGDDFGEKNISEYNKVIEKWKKYKIKNENILKESKDLWAKLDLMYIPDKHSKS